MASYSGNTNTNLPKDAQFSLLSRRVRQTGAVLGFLTGLAIVAWIGFGGPKPPAPALPVSSANCSAPGDTGQVVTSHPMSSDMSQDTPEYFYLYRISYAWTSAIGFLFTVLMGIMAGGFRKGRNDKILTCRIMCQARLRGCCTLTRLRWIPLCWPLVSGAESPESSSGWNHFRGWNTRMFVDNIS